MVIHREQQIIKAAFVVWWILGNFLFPCFTFAQGKTVRMAIGMEKTYPNQEIALHPKYGIAAQFAITNQMQLYLGSAYASNRHHWSRYELEYMANIYVGRDAQVFQHHALEIGTSWMMKSTSSFTLGISANLVQLKRAVFDTTYPFLLYYYGDRVEPHLKEKLDSKQWIPGFFLIIGFRKPVGAVMEIGLQLKYDLVLNVKDLIDKRHNNLALVSISPCLGFRF
jgi:hypothetical protein